MEKIEAFSVVIKAFILERLEKKGKGGDASEMMDWLNDASRRAGQIQRVTHPLKYTHSDAKGRSVFDQGVVGYPPGFSETSLVTASTVSHGALDFDGNAAALDIASFMKLHVGDTSLMDYIITGDASPLRPFAETDIQAIDWVQGFRQMLSDNDAVSHTLAKQVYFPLAKGGYHLLSPLFASSLSHAIGTRVRHARYSEEAKDARSAMRQDKSSRSIVTYYRTLAVRKFGGSKPQNISMLNSEQRGETFLLSCAPPTWEGQLHLPLRVDTIFSRNCLGKRVFRQIATLKEFLNLVKEKNSSKRIRDARSEQVDAIIDQLVFYALEIQQHGKHGWSSKVECRLPMAQKLWLDPGRALEDVDAAFSRERKMGEWRREIADQFARWLNDRLSDGGQKLGDVERREWRELVEERIRLLGEYLEDVS